MISTKDIIFLSFPVLATNFLIGIVIFYILDEELDIDLIDGDDYESIIRYRIHLILTATFWEITFLILGIRQLYNLIIRKINSNEYIAKLRDIYLEY